MEEFIKSLKLEASTENALLGALGQEKQVWTKQVEDTKAAALKDKEKAEKEFKDFKESVKDYDLVKKDLNSLKEKEATLLKEKQDLIANNKKEKIDFAVEKALNKEGARHVDLVKKSIDYSALDLDEEGNIQGLDEAITKSKETYADLFGQAPTSTPKSASNTAIPKNTKDVANWGAEDYRKALGL